MAIAQKSMSFGFSIAIGKITASSRRCRNFLLRKDLIFVRRIKVILIFKRYVFENLLFRIVAIQNAFLLVQHVLVLHIVSLIFVIDTVKEKETKPELLED